MTTTHHSVEYAEEAPNHVNKPAPGISYFTPAQEPPSGTALDSSKDVPKLFTPLKIRGATLHNRIMLSPLCQYSSQFGHITDWQFAHIGGIVSRGPGLTMIEATAVQANGRITPEDAGIWQDSQIAPMKRLVEFAHSQNQLIAIQLAHAGRKASTVAPWLSAGAIAGPELGGWPDDVVAPSALAFNDAHCTPRAMSLQEIQDLKTAYMAATKRALQAGFDVIEIHAAHGYLLTNFLSPLSNKRTDQYGGSFENRVRLLLEVVSMVRATIPDTMPLFVRVSATEWLEENKDKNIAEQSWKSEDTVRLAPLLAERGVDLIDVSSGGNHTEQHPHSGPSYQAPFAKAVKEKVGNSLLVASVGSITEGKQANGLLDEGLDMVIAGRAFQKNPGLVWKWADELGVEINQANQIRWGFGGRGKKKGAHKM